MDLTRDYSGIICSIKVWNQPQFRCSMCKKAPCDGKMEYKTKYFTYNRCVCLSCFREISKNLKPKL